MAAEVPDPAEEALRALVAEIAADEYRGKIGQPLTNNTAYLGAVALLDMRDLLRNGPGQDVFPPREPPWRPGHE